MRGILPCFWTQLCSFTNIILAENVIVETIHCFTLSLRRLECIGVEPWMEWSDCFVPVMWKYTHA